jgi:hypothetical protein
MNTKKITNNKEHSEKCICYHIQKCKLLDKASKGKERIKFAFTPFTKMVCAFVLFLMWS